MRLLTPAELRQIQSFRNRLQGIDYIKLLEVGKVDEMIVMDDMKRDMWLNLLDMALQQNETMKKEWIKNYG